MRRPGQVLSRLHLLEHAWDFAYENRSNVVEVYVRHLRQKIDEPFDRRSLETVRAPATGCARTEHEPAARSDSVSPRHSQSRWHSCSRPPGGFSMTASTRIWPDGLDSALQVARRISRRSSAQPNASLSEDSGGRLIERGESFAQLLDPAAACWMRRNHGCCVAPGPDRAQEGRAGADLCETVPRSLAQPALAPACDSCRARRARARPGRRGATRGNDSETLATFRNELLIGMSIALVLASIAGYFLAGLALRPVESTPLPRCRNLSRDARRAAPGSSDSRRNRAAWRDLGPDAGAPRGRPPARARLRRHAGHELRNAARAAAHGARTGAAPRALDGGAARSVARSMRQGRPPDPTRR